MIEKNLQEINQKALDKVSLALPILKKDAKWDGPFINHILSYVLKIYGAKCFGDIYDKESIPREVKEFVGDAFNYKYRGLK